ncbi:23S rRNA pseudouridine(2605) synthase RluB [Pseudomonas boanensis]|uniref:23S rRNA pseudouridine(2605) synthase RluB n=1 Tax=Metapseudomonas boanensis TaxID=2822138 RepID=UPI0035D4C96A
MSDIEYSPAGEKLQKVLARMGLASRRDIEAWISEGRVKVNGEVASLGQRVDTHDAISVDGRLLKREEAIESVRRVLIYNKPDGEVCTRDDPEGRPTVFERLPRLKAGRWINIGRLDINTTGLLLFTTDGELANRLMHPSYEMDREYAVRVRGEVTDEILANLKQGVMLDDGPAKFTDIQEAPGGEGLNHWYHCVVMEGRNREVRRLWESQGLVVSRLKRVRFGPVFMTSDLTMGRWREMSQGEVDILSAEVGLKPVALPAMKGKSREKLDRLQRKSAKPVPARAPRRDDVERPVRGPRSDSSERPARGPRSDSGERPARGPRSDSSERPARGPRSESGERPARGPRNESSDRPARAPRPAARGGEGRGTPVAERPRDVNKKRPGKPQHERPAVELADRPARKPKPQRPENKRSGPPASEGQRPGFGRRR